MIGKKKFKVKLSEQLNQDAEICTVSDEAFALLLLENQLDHWKDTFHKKQSKTPTLAMRSKKHKQKWESDAGPKYTDREILYWDWQNITHKGWKETGIWHLYMLCQMVKMDRKDNPAMVEQLKVWLDQTHILITWAMGWWQRGQICRSWPRHWSAKQGDQYWWGCGGWWWSHQCNDHLNCWIMAIMGQLR